MRLMNAFSTARALSTFAQIFPKIQARTKPPVGNYRVHHMIPELQAHANPPMIFTAPCGLTSFITKGLGHFLLELSWKEFES